MRLSGNSTLMGNKGAGPGQVAQLGEGLTPGQGTSKNQPTNASVSGTNGRFSLPSSLSGINKIFKRSKESLGSREPLVGEVVGEETTDTANRGHRSPWAVT